MKKMTLSALIVVCLSLVGAAAAQDGSDPSSGGNCGTHPCMTTYHNSNSRTGLNVRETILVANDFPSDFTSSTSVAVDGMIYAQPLYVY